MSAPCLVALLQQLPDLRRLYASHLGYTSNTAAWALHDALHRLPRLEHLTCSGPCQLPGVPAALRTITSLDLSVPGGPGLQSEALSRCCEGHTQLQDLTLRVSGGDHMCWFVNGPEGLSSVATLLFGLLRMHANMFPELTALKITQHFWTVDWHNICHRTDGYDPLDPLGYLGQVSREVHGLVLAMLAGSWETEREQKPFPKLATFQLEVQLPGSCCHDVHMVCGTSAGFLYESLYGPDSESEFGEDYTLLLEGSFQAGNASDDEVFQAPECWRQVSRWELWQDGDTRECSFDQENSLE